jgi:heme oxygenase
MGEVISERPPHRAHGSVQVWLRDETAEAHRAAEHAVMRALIPIEEAHYGAYLQRVLALYEPLEPQLWSACGALVPDSAARFKAAWLREDLAALGLAHGQVPARVPAFADRFEALGAAYVIEGSTLGGPVLLARLRAAGLSLSRERGGARFLSGYGPQSAAMWRAFRSALHDAAGGQLDWAALRRGALGMFHAYECAVAPASARASGP